MKLISPCISLTAAVSLFISDTRAQTYSKCNPTLQSCPPDPALGGKSQVNFASGPSSQYSGTGSSISYNANGAQLAVAASGNNPTLTSSFYLMFGHVDFVIKAAPGVGMVSSAILISDDLDEIDWEILGYQSTQAQTNYFSKGVTGSYNRGGVASVPTSQTAFNTYSIDWTASEVVWSVNGVAVRTLPYSASGGAYPQTPMQVKVGSWAGGDSTNAAGTIQWAGGPINYADGPYVMQVQSVSATDYSTGTQYVYQGTSGTWQTIQAVGGSVNSGSGSVPVTGSGSGSGSGSSGSSPNSTSSASPSSTLSSAQSSVSSAASYSPAATNLPLVGGNSTSLVIAATSSATSISQASTTTGVGSAKPTTTLATSSSSAVSSSGATQRTASSSSPSSTLMSATSDATGRQASKLGMLAGCFAVLFALRLI